MKKKEKKKPKVISRRQFVVGAGASVVTGVAGAIATSCATKPISAVPSNEKEVKEGRSVTIGYILYDPMLCTGCQTCQLICSTARRGITNPKYGAISVFRDDFGSDKDFQPIPCMQCDDPECQKGCEFDALHINPLTGVAEIDVEKCTGCEVCQDVCSFTPSRIYNPDPDTGTFFKCDLCHGNPTCVKWCPNGAIVYKTREEFTPKFVKGLPVEDDYVIVRKEERIKELGYPRETK